jgi:hypothetical protein
MSFRGGIIQGRRCVDMCACVVAGQTSVEKVGPCPTGKKPSGERRCGRIVCATYDRGYAPQLEVLEVIHPAFVFLPCPGASRTRDILARFTRGTSLPLNRVVHFPCKGIDRMAVGTGKKTFNNLISIKSKGDSLKMSH